MSGYTPLFSSIVASTIWRESKETKIVWITMLAMADCRGVVEASVPGLADMSRVTLEEVKAAIARLSAPDEYSRTQEHDGRRIEAIDGGWVILNHAKFRQKSRERAAYMREYRAKRNQNVTNVTTCNPRLPTHTQTHTHTQTVKEQELSGKPDYVRIEFEECWKLYPDKSGKDKAWKAYKAARASGTIQGEVLSGINRYVASVGQRRASGFKELKYANGATWFYQKRWQDECTTAMATPKSMSAYVTPDCPPPKE